MCNLYNITTTREAIVQWTRAMTDRTGFNEPSRDIYPGTLAPVVRAGADGKREIAPLTWGMPSPPAYVKNYDPGVTNIRKRKGAGPVSSGMRERAGVRIDGDGSFHAVGLARDDCSPNAKSPLPRGSVRQRAMWQRLS